VELPPGEGAVHRLLDRYTRRVWRESSRGSSARLAMIVLRKRALSSLWSLARSVERRLAALGRGAGSEAETQLALSFDAGDGESIPDDEVSSSVLGAPGLADSQAELRFLEALLTLIRAAEASGRADAKLRALRRAVARCREPVIVFTEYRDTLRHLARAISNGVSVVCLHGGLLPAARAAAIDAFATGSARVLLATDAAGEGLNLHQRCRFVIHVELPWNPVRLEQRVGRVDRIGQSRPVHVWSLVAGDTDEERVLARLAAREAIAEEHVARRIFEGRAWRGRALPLSVNGRAGAAEACRLNALRALTSVPATPAMRPLLARVRRRGPFREIVGRDVTFYRADLHDASGRRIGAAHAALVARSGQPDDRWAERLLRLRLSRSAAAYRSFARLACLRDEALDTIAATRSAPPVQHSLFDRRASRAAERADAAAAEIAGQLDAHRRGLKEGIGRLEVLCRRVASIVVR
jgi:hypothetical protein